LGFKGLTVTSVVSLDMVDVYVQLYSQQVHNQLKRRKKKKEQLQTQLQLTITKTMSQNHCFKMTKYRCTE